MVKLVLQFDFLTFPLHSLRYTRWEEGCEIKALA